MMVELSTELALEDFMYRKTTVYSRFKVGLQDATIKIVSAGIKKTPFSRLYWKK